MTLPQLQCVICFSAAAFNELSALHCGHTFHFFCIWEWMKNRMQCPVCRKKIAGKDLVSLLSFQIVKDDSSIGNYYEPELQNMFRDAFRYPFYPPELRSAYLCRKIQVLWLLEQMKEFELKNIEEEIQCNFCSKRLHLTDIAALRCGHTFHPYCISRQVKIGHKCPVCKEKVQENSIIPRLFFEIREKNDNSSTIKEAAVLVDQITDILSKLETELGVLYVQIEHNSALLKMLSKMINNCIKIVERT